ncbi:hypothetical protein I9Y33_002285 [Clostridium perfringens]|nr:hypothetical protein [Clostridium perfringens]EGT0014398.1 hypothetical protein [Clostridium perfringens]
MGENIVNTLYNSMHIASIIIVILIVLMNVILGIISAVTRSKSLFEGVMVVDFLIGIATIGTVLMYTFFPV